jgi:para-aminobenzoate synthetase component 1
VLCASPERFLQKQGERLISQPIKGTAKRGQTPEEDAARITHLRTSEKEQAENVMIVDLTRNDLHRSCITGSVEVPYLFEIQTFPTVHQMVSTVTGQVQPGLAWQQVVANTFPPGSMTGAPKVKAMELIRRYEGRARGAYAGSLGYCTPDGDFDLNVVIRSIVWDSASGKLSYHVGGAITYDSTPEAEYEETLLKALAIIQALNINLF